MTIGDALNAIFGRVKETKTDTTKIIELLTEDGDGTNPLERIVEILEDMSKTLNSMDMRLSAVEQTLDRLRPNLFKDGQAPSSNRSQSQSKEQPAKLN